MYIDLLLSEDVFRLNFTTQFLEQLAPRLTKKMVQPEQIICDQEDKGRKFFFLIQGEADIFVKLPKHKDNNINNTTNNYNLLIPNNNNSSSSGEGNAG